jgi:signal transduction histidine kinase
VGLQSAIMSAMDPFFTTKPTGLGGLGLPMVKRFSQEAGGELHIESKPDVGTVVTLRLPLSTSEAKRHQQAQRAASPRDISHASSGQQ